MTKLEKLVAIAQSMVNEATRTLDAFAKDFAINEYRIFNDCDRAMDAAAAKYVGQFVIVSMQRYRENIRGVDDTALATLIVDELRNDLLTSVRNYSPSTSQCTNLMHTKRMACIASIVQQMSIVQMA